MNNQQQQQQHSRAPPPSAFPLPPPPPPNVSLGSSQRAASRQQGGYNYQPSGTAANDTSMQQQQQNNNPPPLASEESTEQSHSGGVGAGAGAGSSGSVPHVKQFAPPAAVPTYLGRSHPGSKPTIAAIAAAPNIDTHVALSTGNAPSPPALSPTGSAVSSAIKSQTQSYSATTSATGSRRYPTATAATASTTVASTTTTNSSSSYATAATAQYPSPYLPTPSSDTLKARNVTSSANTTNTVDTSSYLLTNPRDSLVSNRRMSTPSLSSSTAASTAKTRVNNNKSIALLSLPSLLILFLYEMSSSVPLLVLLCCGLIVYSFDLANVGSDNVQGRGYYTLIAIWTSWLLLSLVVGYDAIFLSDEGGGSMGLSNMNVNENGMMSEAGIDGSSNFEIISPTTTKASLFTLALLLSKLSTSILLLFNMATWTTLQFDWLPLQMPMVATFLERILHATLPPVSSAILSYGVITLSSLSWHNNSSIWGMDSMAILVPHLFAFHLMVGISLVGSASSMMNSSSSTSGDEDGRTKEKKDKIQHTTKRSCAIHPREGRKLSYLLVFLPPIIHATTFRQRITYSYASWDDLFDLILIATVPYTLHYLLASNGVFDEKWRRSLPWVLQVGTSPAEGGERTLRGASVPMAVSLLGAMAFQHRYLVPLCARASYIINGHDGIISSTLATAFLTCGTILAYATVWFFGRKNSNGDEYLLGEYHEDFFQLLLAASSVFYGLSCSPKWTFLPVPMLWAESLALWIITKQLRYAFLSAFVFFTVGTILVAYRLTFLHEMVEILPGKKIILKKFADMALYGSMWLILLTGLILRAPGGYAADLLRRFDVTGVCLTLYCLLLVIMEFCLLSEPMPLYSRDNYEVGRVAVYSSGIANFTGFLTLLITWHIKGQRLIKEGSAILCTSIMVAKMLAVVIESSLDAYDSLGVLYLRWGVATMLLITICMPYLLQPIHVKMGRMQSRKRRDPSAKPTSTRGLPANATWIVLLYCAILLPSVIVASVRLLIEPLVGLLTGQNNTGIGATSPKLSEIIGYSASLWGISVLSMINHFLPDGGAEVWRRVSALTFVMGLFVSFAAPAFPGASPSSLDLSSAFQSVSMLDTDNDAATGGWGLVSAFLAILLAMSGPLELREVKDASGRRDTRQLLRLMIFGMMFGCGLSWFITMQSMSKDIFIPIFVTTFSCMAMSTLGTVAAVMGYFLETREFFEAEQIANVWGGVGFPVFFVISSVSLSAHAHPFGIGGWASTYLSVCGLLAGAFCVMVRLRDEKNSTTRGYGNMSCVISWLCAIIVVYGRYGVAGVGVVGTTSVAGIPASVLGTIFCSPILLLLEGEGASGSGRKKYQVSSSTTRSKKKGLVLQTLTRENWYAPLIISIIAAFLASTVYAIFLRGCGLSKFSLLFGTGDVIKSQEDVFSHVYGSASRTTGIAALDDVATMAKKSALHTKTMVSAARLSGSGIWTAKNIWGPMMHLLGLVLTCPSCNYIARQSWYGQATQRGKVLLSLPLNIVTLVLGKGIPSLVALAAVGIVGGMIQLSS